MCSLSTLRQELFYSAESKLGLVLFRSKEIAGLDSTDFWQQLCLGKTVVLAGKCKTPVCWSSPWPLWMHFLIPDRWSMFPTLLHSNDFCSWILVPSQTSPSDGATVKGTHSHEGGWEQELYTGSRVKGVKECHFLQRWRNRRSRRTS